MPGARQHFLPAAFLGGFSDEDTRPIRQRRLWVMRHDQSKPREATADSIGWEHNVYSDPSSRSASIAVDEGWAYEARLPEALDQLVRRVALNAETWLETLVPFVASLFIRSRDWAELYRDRFPGWPDRDYEEWAGGGVNDIRALEWGLLLAPVMAAEWHVLHVPLGCSAITNDVGYTLYEGPQAGPAIPLNREAVLVLIPRQHAELFAWHSDRWLCNGIQHADIGPIDVDTLGGALLRTASQEIYGHSREAVAGAATHGGNPAPARVPGQALLMGRHRDLSPYEWDYFRALTIVAHPRSDADEVPSIDPFVVKRSWTGLVRYTMNRSFEEGGLTMRDSVVSIDLDRHR